MKSKFYIPKSKYSWLYANRPTKITKVEGNLYCCSYAGGRYQIGKGELERLKACPQIIIEKEIAHLEELLGFYTD